MTVREISAPPNVLALARRAADRPGLAVLASDPRGALRPEDARFGFVACDPVDVSEAWVPAFDPAVATIGWAGHASAPRWVGAIPYEAGRYLERTRYRAKDTRPDPAMLRPRWHRYDAVARVDAWTGTVAIEADSHAAAERLARVLARPAKPAGGVELVREADPEGDAGAAHQARVRAILELIKAGDVYQVNLARALRYRTRGRPLDLFARLFQNAPVPYGFFIEFGDMAVCGNSPELALSVAGDRLRTAPIKGTRPRGREQVSDEALRRELDADPKERAELAMAIDLHRNDLGRVATFGSVRLLGAPRVTSGPTVSSRVAEIVARRAAGTTLEDIARAVVPCGSVTGAPKVRAMEIVAGLEPFRRGLYTGAYGYLGRDGGLVLAMAIRTLEIEPAGRARYCTGGGIVADSDPWRELEETRWKAAHVERLVRGAKARAALEKPSESWPMG